MLSRRQIGPVGFRIAGVTVAFLTNILVAKRLTLDQIGFYYLYVTLAYVGNAALYVGLGVVLQRLCASLASSDALQRGFVVRYLMGSLILGSSVVTLLSAWYLFAKGGEVSPWRIACWCAVLSGATFVSQTGKDLLALSRRLKVAALFGFIEQALRLGLVMFAISQVGTEAIAVAGASAIASLLSGVTAIAVLFSLSNATAAPAGALTLRDAAHTVAPIGFSGLLNWLQLQSYRPILLLLGIEPEVIGIASLLTTLGMTGANPIFTVAAQTYVPRLYSGEASAFKQCLITMARLAVALCIGAVPAAVIFLLISGRRALLIYIFLVPLGVLAEAGNNVIGACIHRRNAEGRSMWILAAAGALGVVIAGASWALPIALKFYPYLIGTAMVLSQLAVIAVIFWNDPMPSSKN